MRWSFGGALALTLITAQAAPAQIYDPNSLQPIAASACEDGGEDWATRALERSLAQPLGLDPVPYPADNPPTRAKIELGRKLFFDRRLSINKTMSCAMCHVPEQAFANWELRMASGVEGRGVKRNAPTLINSAYLNVLFHDGRDTSLETQFVGPLVARNEMANPTVGWVISQINTMPDYGPLFEDAFGAPASLDRVGQAMGAYQRSLTVGGSPFDHAVYGQDPDAMDPAATRGMALFTGEAGCSACHVIGDDSALLSDEKFHDTGYGWMQEQARQNPPASTRIQVAPGEFQEIDFAKVASVSAVREADLGRYEVTENPADRWKIRTPSLRNVGVTPPYMHDGGLSTLADVVAFYNDGGPQHPQQDPRIRPLGLSASEQADLVAFLEALTSDGLACLVRDARSAPPDNH